MEEQTVTITLNKIDLEILHQALFDIPVRQSDSSFKLIMDITRKIEQTYNELMEPVKEVKDVMEQTFNELNETVKEPVKEDEKESTKKDKKEFKPAL